MIGITTKQKKGTASRVYDPGSLISRTLLFTVALLPLVLLWGCSGLVNQASQKLPTVAISLSPGTVSLAVGATQGFTATVTGTSNTAVTWTTTGGSYAGSGSTVTYTAPTTAGTYTVTATSVADTSKTAVATVTVTTNPTVAVSISPSASSLTTGGTQSFTASVTGNSNTSVTW